MCNVPDDWHCWWLICPYCGKAYHASEWCECKENREEKEEDDSVKNTYEQLKN
jgi:hypothetical protein